MTNLGASLGTALAGSILIAALTTAFVQGIQENPDVPPEVSSGAEVELAGGIPFVSNAQLEDGARSMPVFRRVWPRPSSPRTSRRGSTASERVSPCWPLFAVLALYFTRLIPMEPVGTPSGIPAEV